MNRHLSHGVIPLATAQSHRQNADHKNDRGNADEAKFCHGAFKPPNVPSSTTRRTGGNDCNRDALGGFAAGMVRWLAHKL